MGPGWALAPGAMGRRAGAMVPASEPLSSMKQLGQRLSARAVLDVASSFTPKHVILE